MKRFYITILIILSVANCVAVDTLGITDTYKGDEAKKKLLAAAKIGDYLTANAAFTEQGYTGSQLDSLVATQVITASIIDEAVFSLDESKYYKKKDVDNCAQVIQFLGVALDYDSFTTYLTNRTCRLSPNDMFLDQNLGKSSNSGS
ncbi:TIGR04452 family lipoprotein [Leptospira saintgironsiae]|uniref:Lipoprotein n=1 Tax=Leptospira saintgironsiae TaxID=2023183 RepID=A0A2M9YCF2_9LEPT|nr:TIGR04452 family lipoprotein [Leptospira saintgironsiae]PJZ49189.1 lipoprotein [Leptospira saintgironsiae]